MCIACIVWTRHMQFCRNVIRRHDPVSEMTYIVSSATLNSTIPYLRRREKVELLGYQAK